jgi:hypothetical protein
MKTRNRLDHIRVASPCPMNWEQMAGDDRVRHCDLCSLHVYNIAEMSRTDAETLIAKTEGRICARLFRRTDGTVITKDCPVGLRAIRRRIARVAGAAFATILSLCGSVAGQKPNARDKACRQQVKITRKVADTPAGDTVVTGVIQDQVGAVVAGAKISIRNQRTGKSLDVESNADGRFTSSGVSFGTYDITIISPGFTDLVVKDLAVAAKENVSLEVLLTFDGTVELVGVIDPSSLIDISTPNTIIMSDTTIRKLPIP